MVKSSKPPRRGEKAKAIPESKSNHEPVAHSLPLEIQQIILNAFISIIPTSTDQDLTSLIQEVKGHLFNRDFETAFGKLEYTQAYAVRWSAARALGYADIFSAPGRDYLFNDALLSTSALDPADENTPSQPAAEANDQLNIVCIGGGAGAEITALAAKQRFTTTRRRLRVTAVDSGDWTQTLHRLEEAFFQPTHLPSYASQAVRDRVDNRPLLENKFDFEVNFLHQDALTWEGEKMQATINSAKLVTVMFTLNELFSASLPNTTAFLLAMTGNMSPGSHLLVVDSPGSYSEIKIGKKTDENESSVKRYPMKWLLDHTLLEVAKQACKPVWEKVESSESLWFRIDQQEKAKLKYPIELENMRYQLHCYQRL